MEGKAQQNHNFTKRQRGHKYTVTTKLTANDLIMLDALCVEYGCTRSEVLRGTLRVAHRLMTEGKHGTGNG